MQHIDDRNITQGDYVKFICSFSYENDILDILWTVGSQSFLECDFTVQDLDRCFSLSTIDNSKTSTLTIQDTSSLPVGDHLVTCTAVSLSESFTSDPSYIPDMFEVRNTATLTIFIGTSAHFLIALCPRMRSHQSFQIALTGSIQWITQKCALDY